jgi:cytochrome c5
VSGSSHDKHFFDTFMLVIGVLVIIAIGLGFGAGYVASRTQEVQVLEDPMLKASVEERIAPVGKVAITGADNSAVEEKTEAPVALKDMSGEEVFNSTCVACHGSGLAGAPKFGDKALWAPRIAQGVETLHKHALEGYTGKTGTMPAKGGLTTVTDASIIAAVDYMVSKSK